MTEIEHSALQLHRFLWRNIGYSDDWPLHLYGDEEEMKMAIKLLNNLRDAFDEGGIYVSYEDKVK